MVPVVMPLYKVTFLWELEYNYTKVAAKAV